MKSILFYSILITAITASFNKHTAPIPKGMRIFIQDSVYNIAADHAFNTTEIFPADGKGTKADTLHYLEITGNTGSAKTIKLKFFISTHPHPSTGAYDTLFNVSYSNSCYDYYITDRLACDAHYKIISSAADHLEGTFMSDLYAKNYPAAKDADCKSGSVSVEKVSVSGEFNLPVMQRSIIHKSVEPRG